MRSPENKRTSLLVSPSPSSSCLLFSSSFRFGRGRLGSAGVGDPPLWETDRPSHRQTNKRTSVLSGPAEIYKRCIRLVCVWGLFFLNERLGRYTVRVGWRLVSREWDGGGGWGVEVGGGGSMRNVGRSFFVWLSSSSSSSSSSFVSSFRVSISRQEEATFVKY